MLPGLRLTPRVLLATYPLAGASRFIDSGFDEHGTEF
jgi:hypothetical protein